MDKLREIGQRAKTGAQYAAKMGTEEKNRVLRFCAKGLREQEEAIIKLNERDMKEASGLSAALMDRLKITPARLESMAAGLEQVALLPDPIGSLISMETLPSGLTVGNKRVPIGVIAMIYESRPNVTADAFGLCLKSGNAVILRGGKEALRSNAAIVNAIHNILRENGVTTDIIQLIEDVSRETARNLMRLDEYVDVLIPRGGAELIRSAVENGTIPVIETGVGNCHIFVDETADLDMAEAIIINAKTQRPGICNACETLLVHDNIARVFLPRITKALREKGVEIRGDEKTRSLSGVPVTPASEEDWSEEFLDLIIAVKTTGSCGEAIAHINKYNTGHSEAIITESYTNSRLFTEEVDAAAVYVNASTRFTDGGEFGLGAEIGISTQKLHARGPVGLQALTTNKFVIFGQGQTRK